LLELPSQIQEIHDRLGISSNYISRSSLPCFDIPTDLVSIGEDVYGRPQQLRKPAAEKWLEMVEWAQEQEVELKVVSAYRSASYQEVLIQRYLDRGESIESILKRVAAPGFSEHQSGLALDVTSSGYKAVEQVFEESRAFSWLTAYADRFGFTMSFPKDNPHGVIYEPWHWCYQI